MPMTTGRDIPKAVRGTLARLAASGDRGAPIVFAGRAEEFELLDNAVQGVRDGDVGRTVVIQGVPGAGKTALLNEYAVRTVAADDDTGRPVIPVPLRPGDLDNPPMAILQEVDRQFERFGASKTWGGPMYRAFNSVSLAGNALFAAFTKRNFNEFKASARAPDSFAVALEDYVAFRFDRRDSTILLLVDEAQNLRDTPHVRDRLDALHGGIQGRTQATLACFGLASTTASLRNLGLSRLANQHARSIGALANKDARKAVAGTLEIALADCAFDNGAFGESGRSRWIGEAADVILAESGNFPHHMANGCRALAKVVLDDGIGNWPPAKKVRQLCRTYKREYYVARLHPWKRHTIALAHAFAAEKDGWTPVDRVVATLMASDDLGRPVDENTAASVLEGIYASGFIEWDADVCRPALPSLASHLLEQRQALAEDGKAASAIRAALAEHDSKVEALWN